MDITHQEARQLIDLRMDQVLDWHAQEKLDSHIKGCAGCVAYANELGEMKSILQSTMAKHWSARPLPHNQDVIIRKAKKSKAGNFLPARTAMIGITLLISGFALWQFRLTSNDSTYLMPAAVSQIPTPATVILTSTQHGINGCETVLYDVQKNETLADIALKFSTTEESIIGINNLQSKTLSPGTQLHIPFCGIIPTGTITAPTFTITLSPESQLTASTPG